MEKNSQENAIETVEAIETAIDINSLSSETKGDIPSRTKQHRENISQIIVPQYIHSNIEDNYAVTYSEEDNSILGWEINIEENGQQLPDVYFRLDNFYDIESFKLCKKTLLFYYYNDDDDDDDDNRKYLF